MTHWTEETFVEQSEVFATTMRPRVEDAPEEVTALLALLSDHDVEPDDALDVACGIGRHSVELAERGIAVQGLDLSPEYVETARERAVDAGVADRTTFETADMRDIGDRAECYDLVTNLWTAFGYFDEETNEQVAAGLYDRVADGGALVVELANKETMLSEYHDSGAGLNEGKLHVERREYTPETGRMETTFTILRARNEGYEFVGEVEWDLRLYAPAELRRLFERVGFSEVSLYGGLDGHQLERESNRLVVVAEP